MKNLAKYIRDPVAFADDLIKKNERGDPFRLFPEQRIVLKLAFAFDKNGRLSWDTIVYSTIKKDGKSWINAVICVWWSFCAEAPNEIDVRANDLEQSLSRVFKMIVGLLKHNPILGRSAKIQADRILLSNGTIIRAIPQDWKGESGGHQGLISFDELWAYTSENSRRFWDEAPPVPTRKNSFRLVTSYAGIWGESDLLEDQYKRGVGKDEHPDGQGERLHEDLPIYGNRAARLFCYWDHEPRGPWQTAEYLAARKKDQRPNTWLRQYQNRWTTGEAKFITDELWDPCVDPTLTPLLPTLDRQVIVGFDVGVRSDGTGLVGIVREGDTVRLAFHKIWRPPKGEALDIEQTLERYLREVRMLYHVVGIYGDPYQAEYMIKKLENAGFPIEPYKQTQDGTTRMGQVLFDLLTGKNLRMYPSDELKVQALSTVAIEQSRGWRIAKEKSSRKIDGITALAIACAAAVDKVPPSGEWKPEGLGPRSAGPWSDTPSASGQRLTAAHGDLKKMMDYHIDRG